MKRGDRVAIDPNGPFDRAFGEVMGGPKPTKRGESYWEVKVDDQDNKVWSYPASRLTVVGGGDSVGEVPTPDDEPMDMAYERQKDDELTDGITE